MIKKRKHKNDTIIYIGTIFAISMIVIFFFIWGLKVNIDKIDNNTISWSVIWTISWANKDNQYYKNTMISQTWFLINIDYNIQWWYSYKIKTTTDIFYAKSDKYSLNDFLDKDISFSWEVIWFSSDNIPVLNIINIKDIILTTQENNEIENQLEKKEKNKYLSSKWLVINLEWTDFKVEQIDWIIYLYQTLTWNNLSWDINTEDTLIKKFVKIIPYKCEKWSKLYDCSNFIQQAKNYKFNTTINDNGAVFYKLPEVDQYVLINDNNYGYNVYSLSWNLFQFINYINIENLQKQKAELIKNTCQSDNIKLTEILKIQNSWDNYDIVWFDENANKILCKLTISWDAQLIWQLQSLYYTDQNLSEEIKIWDLNEENYLIYDSKSYGYKLYMPKSIKYNSDIINENFWVSWLYCKQVINIYDLNTLNLDPDIKAYYCQTELSKDEIQWFLKNYMVIQNNSKTIILNVKDDEKSKKIVSNIHIF